VTKQRSKLLGGILLISGTTIGAAMLALPVSTGLAGFWPSVGLFLLVWFFMTYAALLLLEVNFGVGEHSNMITMARRTLGRGGEVVAWIAYLLLLYALMAAYISGSGALVVEGLKGLLAREIPSWVGPLPFVILFGGLIYLGARPVDLINRVLMVALFLLYLCLIAFLVPHMDLSLLSYSHLPWAAVPLTVVVTSFGYAIILPSLADYLDRNARRMRTCLWWGSVVPLIVYIIWQLIVLAVVPVTGENGLAAMLQGGQPAASLSRELALLSGVPLIGQITGIFAFLVILTSFLGVSLSLSDFLSDGLRLRSRSWGRLGATALTFIPPLIFAFVYPRGFVAALSYGGIFVAVLLGILPVFMVWSLRYRRLVTAPFRAFGGRTMLMLTALFFIWVVIAHFYEEAVTHKILETLGIQR
jgi:tyrosine-specific transport protein